PLSAATWGMQTSVGGRMGRREGAGGAAYEFSYCAVMRIAVFDDVAFWHSLNRGSATQTNGRQIDKCSVELADALAWRKCAHLRAVLPGSCALAPHIP